MATIQLQSVSYRYPNASEDTLQDLNLLVEDGTTHALLGASGAGKTTLLNLLSGLLPPTAGSILINSTDVSEVSARGRNVALVFQFPVLYESKSVLDNLMFPLLNRGWKKPEARQRAQEIASELEIDNVLTERPAGLSLFQKQLTAIGKSLVRTDVDLVLLDEPLTAVEPAMKWRLRQTLVRFQAQHKLTMIYVTHDQTEALTFAANVSVLANGRILQTGTPEQIYNRPATQFVGNFIGSPGMRFAPCRLHNGGCDLPGISFVEPLVGQGSVRLGLRAEWIEAQAVTDGAWRVTRSQLLGTQSGTARSLLTLIHDDVELLAEAKGVWRVGDSAAVSVTKAVVFDNEERDHAE